MQHVAIARDMDLKQNATACADGPPRVVGCAGPLLISGC